MIKFSSKDFYIIGILSMIGIILILALSWQSNPDLKSSPFMPSWIYNWTDKKRNDTIRTAIPFIILSLFIGSWFCIKKAKTIYFIVAWLSLFLIVVLAEAGQFFIPSRYFDLRDIYWGSIGSSLGLGATYIVLVIIRIVKK